MNILLPVPPVSQLTVMTDEQGEISNNAQRDCVAASIDMLCRYVLHTPENSIFNPDNLKDHAYGNTYVGGTDAKEYVAYCGSLGVALNSINLPNVQQTIARARALIVNQRQPSLFTRSDPYMDPRLYPNETHVCVFKGADDSGLTAHDPYPNLDMYKSDAEWASLLRSCTLWIGAAIAMQLYTRASRDFDTWFPEPDSRHWHCKQTGAVVQDAIKTMYQALSLDGQTLPVLGLPRTNEQYITVTKGKPQVAIQPFERGGLAYDVPHTLDNQPGMGVVYLVKTADLARLLASAPLQAS